MALSSATKHWLNFISFSLITVLFFIGSSSHNYVSAKIKPTTKWDPDNIKTEVFKGAERLVDVQLTSIKVLNDVSLFVTPDISPYVTVVNQPFPSSHQIIPNKPYTAKLVISVPEDMAKQSLKGVLHLKQKNISQPYWCDILKRLSDKVKNQIPRNTINMIISECAGTTIATVSIQIRVLNPTTVAEKLESYFMEQFGTTEPPPDSIIDPPQEIINEINEGSNLPLIFKSGSIIFAGSLLPEEGSLKPQINNLLNLFQEKGIETTPLRNALAETVYTRDDPEDTVLPCGAFAMTLYTQPALNPRPIAPIDTDCNGRPDTFIFVYDPFVHTILRGEDIEQIKNGIFFEQQPILDESAKTVLHELIHATNKVTQCNGTDWLISGHSGPEEMYTHFLEAFLAFILETNSLDNGLAVNGQYTLAANTISPNLTCLEILNIIPPAGITLSNPSDITQTSLTLSWSKNNDSDFKAYRVLRDTQHINFFNSATLTTVTDQNQTTSIDSNLPPNTTYYYKVFVFDKTGLMSESNEAVVTTEQDIANETYNISDNGTGGECNLIGAWNNETRTCTLNRDINFVSFGIPAIQIESDNIVLDGSGHTLNGNGSGYGVYANGVSNIMIKNVVSKNFQEGIYLDSSHNSTIKNSRAEFNSDSGITIFLSNGNSLSDNIAFSNQWYGIRVFASSKSVLSKNAMTGNRYNFILAGATNALLDHTIDTTNTVNGKPIYYLQDLANQTIDSASNAGTLYCIRCNNVTIKNLNISNNGNGVFLGFSSSMSLRNNTFYNNDIGGVNSYGSNDNTLVNNIFDSNRQYGFVSSYSSNNEFLSNTFQNNWTGVGFFYLSNDNVLYQNNFINNEKQVYTEDSSNSSFNLAIPIGGNYWDNFDNQFEGCNDTNNDKYCDSPFLFHEGMDNLPWMNENGWQMTPTTSTAHL